jgi:hypothetical protein
VAPIKIFTRIPKTMRIVLMGILVVLAAAIFVARGWELERKKNNLCGTDALNGIAVPIPRLLVHSRTTHAS